MSYQHKFEYLRQYLTKSTNLYIRHYSYANATSIQELADMFVARYIGTTKNLNDPRVLRLKQELNSKNFPLEILKVFERKGYLTKYTPPTANKRD